LEPNDQEETVEAARRWTPSVVQKYVKTHFNQQEYQERWHRLSMFASMDEQLENRLIAKGEWLHLPQGNAGKCVKWLKHELDPREHAHMMVLVQRTQQLDVNEWREIREKAYERFGEDRYEALLKNREKQTLKLKMIAKTAPTVEFAWKQAIFGAMREEEMEITPEW
jgi:hypothetical protein